MIPGPMTKFMRFCIAFLVPMHCIGFSASLVSAADHWAFQPIRRSAIPNRGAEPGMGHQTAIDSFIAAILQTSGNRISQPADPVTLLRRVTFDLTGLPPTPEETLEFLSDTSPDAYERLIDRLLSNPHFGEAWGRNWLDVVRFAETAGFKEDPLRPTAYT